MGIGRRVKDERTGGGGIRLDKKRAGERGPI